MSAAQLVWTGQASAAGTVAPDSVQTVSAPGVPLATPADGRLHGDGFAGAVTGYRFATEVGFGSTTQQAAAGQELLEFGLELTSYGQSSNGVPNPTPTLVAGDQQETLPAGATDGSLTYYLASVPAAAPVSVTLTAAGFAQTFSFRSGARTGEQPTVLYRSKDDWQADDPLRQTITLATPDPSGDVANAAVDITLSDAALTWFGPDTPSDVPADPGQAWLVLTGSALAQQNSALAIGTSLDYLSALPTSAVTLTIPGQAPVPAMLEGQGGSADETSQGGMFGGTYYFEVPADLTSATVTITPGTVQAEDSYLGTPEAVAVTGDAAFPLSFSSPYVAPAQGPLPSVVRGDNALPATARTGAGGGVPVAAVVVGVAAGLVVGAGLVLFIVLRRRPSTALAPVAWGPSPLLAPLAPSRLAPGWIPPGLPAPSRSDGDGWGPAPGSDGHNGNGRNGTWTPPPLARPRPEHWPMVPAGPLLPPLSLVEVAVLGEPMAVNWPHGALPPSQSVLELLAFLALHPGQRLTGEVLRAALGTGRAAEWKRRTVTDYANALRRALGPERMPDASSGGYRVVHVSTDADRFAGLVTRARTAPSAGVAVGLLADALSLVRGAPFSRLPSGAYGWADAEGLPSSLANAIHTTALDTARVALAGRDPMLAGWAVGRGLAVWPTDELLHRSALDAAAATGHPHHLDQAWSRTAEAFRSNAEPVPTSLVDHRSRLTRR